MVTHDRFVVLISDKPERAKRLTRVIGVVAPCRVTACGAGLPLEQPIAWIIDCAGAYLADTPWFRLLRDRIAHTTPILYLTRDDAPAEDGLVRQFGRPVLVYAKGRTSSLLDCLRRALAKSDTPTGRIVTATGLVERLFSAAGTGADPNPVEADTGTEIVLSTISEVGVRTFLDMVWRHDISVYQHSLSVAGYAAAFADRLGFSGRDSHLLVKAALLHDIGKARIPNAILDKPGPLTPDETAVMRTHSAIGADLLAAVGGFEPAVIDVARWHHERLDGSGYPDGLRGEAIGDLVRLVAICDVHSALTERRVYRPPLSPAEIQATMNGMVGQIDADLLQAYQPILGYALVAP